MRGRIVRVRDINPVEERAWRALAARAVEPNPLYEPDCVIPAAEHQQFGDKIELAFAEEAGRFYACFPIRLVRRWRRFPYPFVLTQVRRMIYCGTPLIDPERGDEAIAAILTALGHRRGALSGRALVFQELAEGGLVDEAITKAAKTTGFPLFRGESWQRGIVCRRADSDYEKLQNSQFRSVLRRRRRRLAEELGAEAQLVDRSADLVAIDRYIEMEAAGYKGATQVALASVPGEPAYFREMCLRFAKEGRLRLLTLEGGGITLAMEVFLLGGEGVFAIKASYDEQFARYAPGVQLQLSAMRFLHETTDAQWIDTCTTPEYEILLRLYPDRKQFNSFFVPLGRNPVDRLAVRTFMWLRPIHKRMYELLQARWSPSRIGARLAELSAWTVPRGALLASPRKVTDREPPGGR